MEGRIAMERSSIIIIIIIIIMPKINSFDNQQHFKHAQVKR
jgi:hypothetical protein